MNKKLIFLDNYRITFMSENVKKEIMNSMNEETISIPFRFISQNKKLTDKVYDVKKILANSINSKIDEIYFGKNGLELIEVLINKFLLNYLDKKNKGNFENENVIVEKITCPVILNSLKKFEKKGLKINYVNCDSKGDLDFEDLKKLLDEKPLFVFVNHVNHMLGTIQNINRIGDIISKYENTKFFVLDEFGFLKFPLDVKNDKIDLLIFSAYKIYGPVISAFYINENLKGSFFNNFNNYFDEVIINLPYLEGFKRAVLDFQKNINEEKEKIKSLQKYTYNLIKSKISDVKLFGPELDENRDFSNLFLSFKYVEGESIYLDLSFDNVIVYTTSACANERLESNNVILGVGGKFEESHGGLRITFANYNNKEDVDFFVEKLKISVERLRKISPLKKK